MKKYGNYSTIKNNSNKVFCALSCYSITINDFYIQTYLHSKYIKTILI